MPPDEGRLPGGVGDLRQQVDQGSRRAGPNVEPGGRDSSAAATMRNRAATTSPTYTWFRLIRSSSNMSSGRSCTSAVSQCAITPLPDSTRWPDRTSRPAAPPGAAPSGRAQAGHVPSEASVGTPPAQGGDEVPAEDPFAPITAAPTLSTSGTITYHPRRTSTDGTCKNVLVPGSRALGGSDA